MPTYVDDGDGMVSETCLYHCAPARPAPCDGPDCECTCHRSSEPWVDPELVNRARELDDRPGDKLHVIAAELERERMPTLDELRAERYGPRPRRAA